MWHRLASILTATVLVVAGLTGLAAPAAAHDTTRYYLYLALTGMAFVVAWRMSRTRVGRSFSAMRRVWCWTRCVRR